MKTILVADDDAANRELVCAILDRHGFRVVGVEDGTEALHRAQAETPDLILLDIHMPRLDGYETLKQIRHQPALRTVPTVAVTASAMAGDEERSLTAGFSAYLAKPYEVEDIVGLVVKLLSNE
jgi:CheY-like chemotaxis protein